MYKSKRLTNLMMGRKCNFKDVYGLVYHNQEGSTRGKRGFIRNGYVALPIQNIKKEFYNGKVYDIEVENNHNFVTQYYTVKNCEFIDESLAFFPYEIINGCQTIKEFMSSYRSKNPIYFGIDFGRTTSQTIVYIVEEVAPGNFKTLYIEIMPGVHYDEQVEIIKSLKNEYNPTLIKIDASGPGGDVLEDILSKEENCGNIIQPFDLTATVKENLIIHMRMLMQRKKFALPSKDSPNSDVSNIAEKLEHQLHGIQRTSTKFGLHTRYSGKETAGMDDMVWAACLAVYQESEYSFDPMIVMQSDSVLTKLNKERTRFTETAQTW
jgi:phage FluMu gp28-like protein